MRSSLAFAASALLLCLQPAFAQNLEERGHDHDVCVSIITSIITVTQTATEPASVVTVTVTASATVSPFSSLGPVGIESSSTTGSGSSPTDTVSPVSSLLAASHTHTKTHTHTKGPHPTGSESSSPSETGSPTGPHCHGCPPGQTTNTNGGEPTKTKTHTRTKTHGTSETVTLLPASQTSSLPACSGVSASIQYITVTDVVVQTVTGWAPSATPLVDRRHNNKMWGSW